MTTIAFDATTVAWDMQDTNGSRRSVSGVDKVVIINNTVYGCAGDASCCEEVPRWHAAGKDLDKIPEGTWEMVCVTIDEDGNLIPRIYTNGQPLGWTGSFPLAVGSGGDFAISALYLNMSAVDAVKHAVEYDVFSGHPIKSLKYSDVLKRPRRSRKPTPRNNKRN